MTKEELFECLAREPGAAVRLAQQPGWDFRLMRELAQEATEHPGVELFLASAPNVPNSILKQLCQHSADAQVIRVLAQNPNCQEELCRRAESWIRREVAASRRLAPKTPAQLLADSSVPVRCQLARNPAITPGIQTRLSQDPVPMVRLALLENRKTDPEVLMALCDDKDTTVHLAALLAPNLPYDCISTWAAEGEELGLLALCRRTDLPATVVAQIGQNPSSAVRMALLRHQKLPEDLLYRLAQDSTEEVLQSIAARPDIQPPLQRLIWQRGRGLPAIRLALAANHAVDAGIALELAACTGDRALLETLALNPGAAEDSGDTPRPDTEDTLLEAHCQLAGDGDTELLKLLLANPCARCMTLLRRISAREDRQLLWHIRHRGLDTALKA